MAEKLIPKQALDYIKNKKLRPAFSYKDVWNEEHATAFTVAKAMQLDVLSDIKGAVEKAIVRSEIFQKEGDPANNKCCAQEKVQKVAVISVFGFGVFNVVFNQHVDEKRDNSA